MLAVAIESDSGLQELAGEAFARWEAILAEQLGDAGLATMVVAALEGALVLARARKDIAPLDAVHQQLRSLIAP